MSMAVVSNQGPITNRQMQLLMQQLRSQAGIRIETPRSVIERNVQDRMAALGLGSPGEYFSMLDGGIGGRAEWLALIDLLSVKETRFFRQPAALEVVADELGALLDEGEPDALSFWSAGCSTGQELYSIAMVVQRLCSKRTLALEWHGIGTDISFDAVNQSLAGRYREAALESLPSRYRDACMQPVDGGDWEVRECIRSRTHFFHSNLLHVNSAPFSDFNIIFCQNVLIYFEHDTQLWIIDQLVERLQPGGLLVLGAGEDAWWKNSKMRRLSQPGVCAYKKVEV